MAAWDTFDWDDIPTRMRAKSSIAPTEQDVRSILKVINGIDKIHDAPPKSVSGKCHYYIKVFFNRTPWLQAIFFTIFVVTFSLTVDGLSSMQNGLDNHNFTSTSFLSFTSNRSTWLAILLSFCISINFLVYIFSLFGSQFCLAKRFSKWGSTFICSLYFLRLFEGFLFIMSCIVLLLVGFDSVSLVSNSNSIATFRVLCEASKDSIPAFTEGSANDRILSSFLDIKVIEASQVDAFCKDIDLARDNLSSYWYANFFALIAQVILTICAYQNYMITKAVWESSLYGSEVELELEKRRSEREAAKELKKKQKAQQKAEKKKLEDSMAEKRFPGHLDDGKKVSVSIGAPKRTPSAYGGGESGSAYGNESKVTYVSDSDSDGYGGEGMETTTTRESSANAFDGGEWWKE